MINGNGMSKEVTEQDHDKPALVFILVKIITESSNKRELMEDLFLQDGVKFTPISERSKEIMKQQGNVDMFDICEHSNKVQCEHCRKYVPSGHVYCGCGRAVVRKTKQRFELLTTPEFVLIKGPTRGRQYSKKLLKLKNEAKKMALHNARRHECELIFDRWVNDDIG